MSEATEEFREGGDHAGELEAAREELARLEERIESHGEDTLETVADAYRDCLRLLEAYEDSATGTGRSEFAASVNFKRQFGGVVARVDDDDPGADALQSAHEAIKRRRLSTSDFERARAALEPVETYADLLEDREAARSRVHRVRRAAQRRLGDVADEIEATERLLELAAVDLDAPVDRLRDPIDAYDEGVREAFDEFVHDAPAREVLDLLAHARWFPLVPFDPPPEALHSFLRSEPAGEEPIHRLLELAEYSHSKLDHYVEDAGTFKRHVATEQTYLEGLSPDPLTVGWPPPPAATLRYRLREARALLARFAPESVLADLRTVRRLTRAPFYEELRQVAVARSGLTETERERIAAGDLEDELARLEAQRERLERVLDE